MSSRSLAVRGGDGKAAVAGHHRRHAVEARRRERRVPEHLGVVVGVDVDETRRHDVAGGVELDVAVKVVADLGDAPPLDRDVGPAPWRSCAVDDRPASYHCGCSHRVRPPVAGLDGASLAGGREPALAGPDLPAPPQGGPAVVAPPVAGNITGSVIAPSGVALLEGGVQALLTQRLDEPAFDSL